MKKILVGLGLLFATPFVLMAASQPVNCTLSASPSSIQNGVSTKITLTYTTSNADWMIWEGEGGGGARSGSRTVYISGAKRFELFAIDTATGNAHYCVASVSSRSRTQPI